MIFFDLALRFIGLIVPLLITVDDIFPGVFLLLVVEDDPLKAEGVEEGPLGQGSDMFRVDGSDLICSISLHDDLIIL